MVLVQQSLDLCRLVKLPLQQRDLRPLLPGELVTLLTMLVNLVLNVVPQLLLLQVLRLAFLETIARVKNESLCLRAFGFHIEQLLLAGVPRATMIDGRRLHIEVVVRVRRHAVPFHSKVLSEVVSLHLSVVWLVLDTRPKLDLFILVCNAR